MGKSIHLKSSNEVKSESFFRPPAGTISGSHTLQYPRNKQQEMLAAQQHQQQQQQRTLGTHTLGRLPSHNHSPSHHGGGGKHGKFYEFSFLLFC